MRFTLDINSALVAKHDHHMPVIIDPSHTAGSRITSYNVCYTKLLRYTHRVAISNRRLVAMDENGVSFRWKDYRAKGRTRHKTMTLAPEEFMRRFLLHVLPSGFHRIPHYGLLANAGRHITSYNVCYTKLLQAVSLINLPLCF